jgi:hypothetical protein
VKKNIVAQKTLVVLNKPTSIHLNVAELSMVEIPKHKFNTDTNSSWDKFTDFFATVMTDCICNLIMHEVLIFKTVTEAKKILGFIKYNVSKDYLEINFAVTFDHTVGYLEYVVYKMVDKYPGLSLEEHVKDVLNHFLGANESFVHPSKEIICQVIDKNLFNYWSSLRKNRWFTESMVIDIDPRLQAELKAKYARLKEQLAMEIHDNPDFFYAAARIEKIVRRRINRREASD